jgi:hypothetical protein
VTLTARVLVLPLGLVAGLAAAQTVEKPRRPPTPPTPLKLQVVFSRFRGDEKLASLPYTLSLNADEASTRLRMGVQVPLRNDAPDAKGDVVFTHVGTNLDCNAQTLSDGRFKVACALEQSSLHADSHVQGTEAGPPGPPVLRTFRSDTAIVLRDSQTAQYVAATDPVTGEVLKVDVTLHVVK